MAFKISKKPTYTVPVEVHMANGNGGFTVSKFKAEFKRCEMERTAGVAAETPTLDELRALGQKEVQLQVLVGWSEFIDEDDTPVPFNEGTLAVLLNIPQALAGLTLAFWSSVVKAPEKN